MIVTRTISVVGDSLSDAGLREKGTSGRIEETLMDHLTEISYMDFYGRSIEILIRTKAFDKSFLVLENCSVVNSTANACPLCSIIYPIVIQ